MPKITTKGQVTIPQDVRNRFALLPAGKRQIQIESGQGNPPKAR